AHRSLEQAGVPEVWVTLPSRVPPARVLRESPRRDPIPHFAHARKAGGQRSRVRREDLFRWRLVKRAVDPHRAKQGIAHVFLEPSGRLGTAIGPMIDLPGPTIVGPGGRPEPDLGRDA